jgi:hypothetical protein
LELEIGWAEGARERESSSKPVVVVMNVADPHITTKWNMVGEGRGGEERKHAFSSMHHICAFITYTIPSSFFLSTFIFVFL